MKGNTIQQFIDDLLTMGGPEKEFVFRGHLYFLETIYDQERQMDNLYIVEYDNIDGAEDYKAVYNFRGNDFSECVKQFEKAPIFDGLTIRQAEQEIEVLFG